MKYDEDILTNTVLPELTTTKNYLISLNDVTIAPIPTNFEYAYQLKKLLQDANNLHTEVPPIINMVNDLISDIQRAEYVSMNLDLFLQTQLNLSNSLLLNNTQLKKPSKITIDINSIPGSGRKNDIEKYVSQNYVGYDYTIDKSKKTIILTLDPFYDKYFNGKLPNSMSNRETYAAISKEIKHQLHEQIKPFIIDDSNPEAIRYNVTAEGSIDYQQSGLCMPTYNSKEGRFPSYIDCSSYVSMTLYEYAIYKNDPDLMDFINTYRVNGGHGSDLGKGGQINADMYKYLDDSTLETINLEKFQLTNESCLQPGDILASDDHVEIYAGDGRVYSCGSTERNCCRISNWNTRHRRCCITFERLIYITCFHVHKKYFNSSNGLILQPKNRAGMQSLPISPPNGKYKQ